MKATLLGLCLIYCASAYGKIWIVDSNVGSTAKDFTNLQAAHDGAAAGDTLYMIGSPNNYITARVTMTKMLIIIGPGYFLSENPDTQASIASAFIDDTTPFLCEEIVYAPGSQGSVIMGMVINGRIVVNTDNIVIKRNFIQQIGGCGSSSVEISGSNVSIVQNFIQGGTLGSSEFDIKINSGFSSIFILNNYLFHPCSGCGGGVTAVSSVGSIVEITNNIFTGGLVVSNSLVQNNIFTTINVFSASSSTVRNNLHIGVGSLPGGNGNINGVNMTDVFLGSGSSDGRWQLKVGSPALGAGFGGIDCGIFSGLEPYVLSGIPPIPTIYSLSAPLVGEKNVGLPIQIKVKSNN